MKPLIVPDKLLKKNKAGGGSCAVSMEHLVIRPVCNKLPTARRGTQFRPYNAAGQQRPQICKNGDNEEETSTKISKIEKGKDVEGNANIEKETLSYDDWLAEQGLASPHPQKYNLEMKVEDLTSEDSDSTSKKGKIDDPSRVDVANKLEILENVQMSDKLDILTQDMKGMISRGEGEAESEKRKSRLQMFLKLLSDKKEESEKIVEQMENVSSICKQNMEKAEKPDSVTEVIKPVKETSKIISDKKDEPESVPKVVETDKGSSGTPQKVEKASKDGKGKMEVSDEGGGGIVISEESAIHKIISNKKDEPESVPKVIETDKGSSGTPKRTECAETQIEDMNKDDTGDKNAGIVAMNEIRKRTENELDEKGADEMEMAYDSECVDSSDSMEDCSSNETELACESQGEGQEEIHK